MIWIQKEMFSFHLKNKRKLIINQLREIHLLEVRTTRIFRIPKRMWLKMPKEDFNRNWILNSNCFRTLPCNSKQDKIKGLPKKILMAMMMIKVYHISHPRKDQRIRLNSSLQIIIILMVNPMWKQRDLIPITAKTNPMRNNKLKHWTKPS